MIGWSCTSVLVPLCFSFSEAAIHAWPKVLYVTVFAPHLSRRVNLLHCMAYPLYQTLSWLFRSSGRCLAGILDKLVASCCCLSGKPSSPAPLFSPLSQPLRSLRVDEDVRLYLTQTFARVRVNVKQNKTNKQQNIHSHKCPQQIPGRLQTADLLTVLLCQMVLFKLSLLMKLNMAYCQGTRRGTAVLFAFLKMLCCPSIGTDDYERRYQVCSNCLWSMRLRTSDHPS